MELVTILWLAQHDPDAATAEAALDLWEDCACELPQDFLKAILKYLCSPHADIRTAAAEALGFGLQVQTTILASIKLQGYKVCSLFWMTTGTACSRQA